MPFDIAQLDEFSGSFAEALFAAQPEWVAYARVDIAEDGETPDLVVKVPSSWSEEGTPELVIYTEDSEVTISFDFYHSHFNWPAVDDDANLNPLSFILAVLNEDVAVASGWNGGKWAGSWLMRKGEPVSTPKNMPIMETIRIRSWRGTLNLDMPGS